MRVALTRVPIAFRAAASLHGSEHHRLELISAAEACESNPTNLSFIAARKAAQNAELRGDARVVGEALTAAANAAVEATAPLRVDNDPLECAVTAALWAAEVTVAVKAASKPDAGAGARDEALTELVETVVQVLIEMRAPGCQWLKLAESVQADPAYAPAA